MTIFASVRVASARPGLRGRGPSSRRHLPRHKEPAAMSRNGSIVSRRHSRSGRGRVASLRANRFITSRSRFCTVKARVVRHKGLSSPLARHLNYLRREGVTRDDQKARLFGAGTDDVDAVEFAERCKDDRHHFRFIVSPEDAIDMSDLRQFTRELMAQAETSARRLTGPQSTTGIRTTRTSTSSCVAAPMTARTSLSTATTSRAACGTARRTSSPRSWAYGPTRISIVSSTARSWPNGGRFSIANWCAMQMPTASLTQRRCPIDRPMTICRKRLAGSASLRRSALPNSLARPMDDIGQRPCGAAGVGRARRHHQAHAPRADRAGN